MAFNYPSPGKDQPANPNLRLAAGKSNGDIEIYNPLQNWNLDLVLHGSKGRSIESLVWSPDHLRLYSVGATEKITEWDLESMQAVAHYDSFAGVIWSIEVSPDGKRLAAVCETGVVVIFDISGPQAEFVKRLPSADTSLACVAWLSNNRVVAGGADARLRVWDLPSSRIVATMKVDKGKGIEKTLIWKVISLGNDQFVSGDSNGFIKFWDSKTCTLNQSFEAHPGDVLCLAADSTGKSVFSSGLDQKIIWLRMTNNKLKRWSVMSSRVAHTQDVRCMALYEAKNTSFLASGGLQKHLVINSVTNFDQNAPKKLPIPPIGVASTENLIYNWSELTVSIWILEEGKKRRLGEIHVGDEEYISACALNKELELLFVGTRHSFKVFKLEGLAGNKITNVERTLDDLHIRADDGVAWAGFHKAKLIYVNYDREVCVIDVKTNKSIEIDTEGAHSVKTDAVAYGNNVKFAQISPNGKLLAVCKHSNYIDIYDIAKLKLLDTLPRPGECVTAIAFKDDKHLLVATIMQMLYEFDLSTMGLSKWSKQHSRCLPYKLTQQDNNCGGIFADPSEKNKVWMWGSNWMAYLDLSTTKPYRNNKRKFEEFGGQPETEVEISESTKAPCFWLTEKYKPILFASPFGKDLLVSEYPQQPEPPAMWSRHIKF